MLNEFKGVLNLLQHNFQDLHVEILASNGEMRDDDYDTKILEAFHMLGIEVEEWHYSYSNSS